MHKYVCTHVTVRLFTLCLHFNFHACLGGPQEHLDASIGESLFSEMARKEFMSSKDYARWREVVEQRRPLDPDTAEAYATALRKWSLLRG